MTISIITGTIIGAKDINNDLFALYQKGLFERWYFSKQGWFHKKAKIISNIDQSKQFSIIQTTGSGKTILAIIYLYKTFKKGISIKANMKIGFSVNNLNKPKEKWKSDINCLEDLEDCFQTRILLDDIRHVISSWNSKDSKIASEFANSSRKKGNWIDITTQRLENFVPPDIRMISDEIIVPYIRSFDTTKKAPDNRYMPLEIIALKFSPGYEFMGYERFNLSGNIGKLILEQFDTLQISENVRHKNDKEK